MTRLERLLALAAVAAASLVSSAGPASAQAVTPRPGGPDRFRLVLNASFWITKTSFNEVRTFPEYAETTTIKASYEAGTTFGPDVGLQASFFRGLGLLVGYSYSKRDLTGQVDVSRPHPLYLNQPRSASAAISGYGLTERALHVDAAYAGLAGHIDWALFAGITLFQIEADLLQRPTYNDVYPYDELTITSTPSTTVKESPTGFNVGGRLDYRFGGSQRFGVGVMARYSKASVTLKAEPAAPGAAYDAGGMEIGAGLRVYF